MRPAPNLLTTIDELPSEAEIEFGIGDPKWVMRTQARLYSDITTAIIREYSTNAWDSHVEAGVTDPIEVTLPSVLDNHFIVRDHGLGMSLQTLDAIYTKFGNSTGREDTGKAGMLGYGSKSGVAYCPRFQVTTVKDGVRLDCVIQRRDDWSIVLKVVAQTKTDEANGTEIRIPVHNVEEFNAKAANVYKFWLPGRVLVDGVEPVHSVGEKIADNLYYARDWGNSFVVMNNVAYRINNPDALFRNTKMNSINFVAYVDDLSQTYGHQAIEFTPSREDLEYTDRTKDTLQQVISDFETEIVSTAKAEIDGAADHASAYAAWERWTSRLGRDLFSDLTYKGDKFENVFKFTGHRYYLGYSRGGAQQIRDFAVDQMSKTMIVTECDVQMSSNLKKKAKDYKDLKGWNGVTYILFTKDAEKQIVSKWIPRDKFVTYADLKAALPKKQRVASGNSYHPNAGRVPGSWDYYDETGYHTEKPIPASVDKVYWISVGENKRFNPTQVMRYAGEKNYAVLVVPMNRLNKLKRDVPTLERWLPHVQGKVVKDGAVLLSAEAKAILDMSRNTREWLGVFDTDKVDDPDLALWKDQIANQDELTKDYTDNNNLARMVGMWYNVTEYRGGNTDPVVDRYPLLASLSRFNLGSEVYIYLNAKYALIKENSNV